MSKFKTVLLGASHGGINAWKSILTDIDIDLPASVIIIQHQTADSSDSMCQLLSSFTQLPVNSVKDGMAICSGQIYLAPANYHLLINHEMTFSLDLSSPVQFSRPSIDVTLMSAASVFNDLLIAVLLSGSNNDGALGMFLAKNIGCTTIIEDPTTAEAPNMPQQALKLCQPDFILSKEQIALKINNLTLPSSSISREKEIVQ